jgi:hypothetical protein
MISRFLASSSFFNGSSACVCCSDASPLVENDSGSGFVFASASASVDAHLRSERSGSSFVDAEENGSRCRDRKGEWSCDIERDGR